MTYRCAGPITMDTHRAMIERYGQSVIGVFNEDPPFAYTIGNAGAGFPELLIIGPFPMEFAAGVLNACMLKMRVAGECPDEIDIGFQLPARTREASPEAKARYTVQAGQYLDSEDYRVRQVMLWDRNNKYPGDEGCDPKFDVPLV